MKSRWLIVAAGAIFAAILLATSLIAGGAPEPKVKNRKPGKNISMAAQENGADFPKIGWAEWGKEIADVSSAAAAARSQLRMPKAEFGGGPPKIYVQDPDLPTKRPYALVYPNGFEMTAYPESPNPTLDFDLQVRESSNAVPADRRSKLLTIHGKKALGLEKGFNSIDDEELPRPAVVVIYEDGIRYTFYAPIGVPLAALIPVVETTR